MAALDRSRSKSLHNRAKSVIPGGVNSPVRAFGSVGGEPCFIERGEGAYIFDVDGNKYIDMVCSWGPLVLGHANNLVLEKLQSVSKKGLSFGAPTELEVELAELVCDTIPGIDMLRTVSSGTEATMSAIRLARGYTGRELIIKCDGCYHGHGDSLLVEAGSGVATLGISGSPGVSSATANQTISIPYNSVDSLKEAISIHGAKNIAAFIIEPVPGNMGLVLPKEGYLKEIREICSQSGIVLIFDEVMSGFRVSLGGAGDRFGVQADLITLGKVIGGGLPAGAFGGKREIMEQLAPIGPVYQAGTLSGNPLAVTAGLTTLKILLESNPYPALEENARSLVNGIKEAATSSGVPIQVSSLGSMFGFFFSDKPVTDYQEAKEANAETFKKFFWGMLDEGVYLAPSPFEAGFLSTMHDEAIISKVVEKADLVFKNSL